MLKHSIYLLVTCALLTLTASMIYTQNLPVVKTRSGLVQGINEDGATVFKGIPYAKPPRGELRWRAPQPLEHWSGTYNATEFGHDCMQAPLPGDDAPLRSSPSEDCLFLNIWKPEGEPTTPLPVLVWIYGGGFVNGGSSPAMFSGHEFAKKNIVAVSFNYRIGRFGFFAHPALTRENKDGVLGNYGFMDQIAALKWVQENIRNFGGDPDQVTLMGESAGGFSVHVLLTSQLSQGLYKRAIIQSGGGRGGNGIRLLSAANSQGMASAESTGVAFARKMGIKGQDQRALDALRNLPAKDIVNGLSMATMNDPTYSGPIMDGTLMVNLPEETYKRGKGLNMPVLVGTTDADIGLPPTVETVQEALAPFGEDKYQEARSAYGVNGSKSPQAIAQAIASDILMVEPARFVMQQASKQPAPVYGYRFGYVADSKKSDWSGAYHSTDVPYAFNTLSTKYGADLTEKDQAMASLVFRYWVNFIKTGSPNGEGLPRWTPFNSKKEIIMVFDNRGADASTSESDPWAKRLNLVESLHNKSFVNRNH
ncbi:carboxylesterase family protein [Desulfopila sp. IMCC35006]|uniref:carboxylesterase/lipase family protein n=1 Tax=Desulfopila sp. IMCC35006 TaxID=2569542 RepID=UPI0010ABA505|nr:carboxylesterase family protein [Desulfopila sp. IMCC35006]TKB25256.1 carboxylesterase family protein [Desulfopila sp. IMCC35006]